MKIFIDSGDIAEIKEAQAMGAIDENRAARASSRTAAGSSI